MNFLVENPSKRLRLLLVMFIMAAALVATSVFFTSDPSTPLEAQNGTLDLSSWND